MLCFSLLPLPLLSLFFAFVGGIFLPFCSSRSRRLRRNLRGVSAGCRHRCICCVELRDHLLQLSHQLLCVFLHAKIERLQSPSG